MKPERQIVVIAQAMGWERSESPLLWHNKVTGFRYMVLPDYLHDLNAMHKVETSLIYSDEKLPKKYTQQIKAALCRSVGLKKAKMDFDMCITAAADIRAEALLKTIGKWGEAK